MGARLTDDLAIRPFRDDDREAVIGLWGRCDLLRPWNDPGADIDRKLGVAPDGFLVGTVGGRIVATVMTGYDGHRGWVNYLAVAPEERRAGLGTAMMRAAEEWLTDRGCPKVNLQVRAVNPAVIAFYEAIGFRRDDVVSFGRRLVHDDPPAGA